MVRESLKILSGDWVIVYFSRDQIFPLIIDPEKTLNTRFGSYPHADLVDKPFGSKVAASGGRGFAYLLKPTPELWTIALPHRTQILYLPDIAYITSHLDILPGKTVIEAGTGSGSFTHAVARSLGSAGRLYSYEFHQERFEQARQEFHDHKLENVILEHRNVCKDGFGDAVQGKADALFLDVPSPWQAIPFAKLALRNTAVTRICCFSPCIEQVIRTVACLTEHGFTNITMYETLVRHHDTIHAPPSETVQQAVARLQTVEVRKEERRQKQIARTRQEQAAKNAAVAIPPEEGGTPAQPPFVNVKHSQLQGLKRAASTEETDEGRPAKRIHIEVPAMDENATMKIDESPSNADTPEPSRPTTPQTGRKFRIDGLQMARALPQVRGHTSYLTFAVLVPDIGPVKPTSATNGHIEATADASEEMEVASSAPPMAV